MISVILPTNRLNTPETMSKLVSYRENILNSSVSPTDEFQAVVKSCTEGITHFLDITMKALEMQEEKDFEVIICHKHPEDVTNKYNLNFRVIKEKYSIWHDIGDSYRTVNNNRNTGIMNSKGDVLLFLDDFTFFNKDLIGNIKQDFEGGRVTTFKSMRRIRFVEPHDRMEETANRKRVFFGNMTSGFNFKNVDSGDDIPMKCTWTYGCTVSREDCIGINGFDEIYDGNFGGTDEDFGLRLSFSKSSYSRVLGKSMIYEFSHPTSRKYNHSGPENLNMFRQHIGQLPRPQNIVANSWKPNDVQLRRYKNWYLHNFGMIDTNWDKFMDVPLYNLRECTI